jgi:putative ABC transport system ATP-binding protein
MSMILPEHVGVVFRTRRGEVKALQDVSLHIRKGEFVVIRGPSGSGKTTLLLTVGGMLRPTEGRVLIDGTDLYALSGGQRARFRRENTGFVFQMFHLVPYLGVLENVLLPGNGSKGPADRTRARELLGRLGLSDREHHRPAELSAGEMQRTAIARALLNRPRLILADEPTGNLDPENAADVIEHLATFHREGGTVVVVTHGSIADPYADRIVHLRGGRVEESVNPS